MVRSGPGRGVPAEVKAMCYELYKKGRTLCEIQSYIGTRFGVSVSIQTISMWNKKSRKADPQAYELDVSKTADAQKVAALLDELDPEDTSPEAPKIDYVHVPPHLTDEQLLERCKDECLSIIVVAKKLKDYKLTLSAVAQTAGLLKLTDEKLIGTVAKSTDNYLDVLAQYGLQAKKAEEASKNDDKDKN
jgi:hypothetical protein